MLGLRWQLINTKSAPEIFNLLRQCADAMARAERLLAVPHPSETDHLTMAALLDKSVKNVTVLDGERENYVDDSKAFDDAMRIFRSLYRNV